ncbi:MAG: allantoinase AllB [Gemmatimonadota bacterium]|nr:allantoinase AllB [Gemmatimonadota bacterium]
MRRDIAIRSRRVVARGGITPATILTSGGRVSKIAAYDFSSARDVMDAGNDIVMAGLVDTHVHIDEPGRTDWEGFHSGTRAAAAGGVTTLLDMPLNSTPATTSLSALIAKEAAAAGSCFVDVGFIGGVVPGNAGELEPLFAAGVLAFKCFLVPSGVPDFPPATEPDLREALPVLSRLGAPLMVHAEAPDLIDAATDVAADSLAHSPREYASYLRTRPATAEVEAVSLLVALAHEYGAWIHIVHVSSADAIPVLARARAEGARVTAESCPHYLFFCAEEIADGATEYKCAPPIRGRDHREALWDALGRGTLDMVVSDHSPCPPALKCRESGHFLEAWGGISSLQLGLGAVWSGARARGHGPDRLSEWMSAAPAALAGLESRKGVLAPGADADIIIWSPDEDLQVRPESLHHRHALTPYLGVALPGVVRSTYLRGQLIYDRGEFVSDPSGVFQKHRGRR